MSQFNLFDVVKLTVVVLAVFLGIAAVSTAKLDRAIAATKKKGLAPFSQSQIASDRYNSNLILP